MSGKKAREERREQRLAKASETEQQERRQRLIRVGSAAAFLAIAVVAVLIIVSQSGNSGGDTNLEGTSAVNKELAGIPQSEMTLGAPKAKVTLFEYGDLQCPVCKEFSEEALPDVIDTRVRTGDAKVAFLNYPIINEESVPAGAAAIAAGKQGRGWYFVELFYRNQGEEASGYVTDDFLTEVARGAGVPDIGKWNKDRKSQAVLNEVSKSTNEAQELGFTGTPSFAVSGPNTSGKQPLGSTGSAADLEEAIDEAG
jgi:protein-disulfide isomerase